MTYERHGSQEVPEKFLPEVPEVSWVEAGGQVGRAQGVNLVQGVTALLPA